MDVWGTRTGETSSYGVVGLLEPTSPGIAPATSAEPDVLDVSLHDSELALEVELLGRLMVAANEADDEIARQEVDRILDLASLRPPPRPTVP